MKRVTRADIERLALENPTVRACIEAQRGHGVKWDDALMAMVWYLHEDLQAQRAMNVRLMERMPAEHVQISDVRLELREQARKARPTYVAGDHIPQYKNDDALEKAIYDFARQCQVCHRPNKLLYLTNMGRRVCANCSVNWKLDVSRNELIEPTGIVSGTGEGDVLYG